ncbi:MAG: hypothetical protein KAV00_14340 [Phycisphaerae bacterium]|nr:hypothetical protein [Phycisphaerae bacterium]
MPSTSTAEQFDPAKVQPSVMEGIQTLPFPYGSGGFARPDERTVDFRVRYTFGGLFFSPEGTQVFSHEGAQVLSHGRQPVEYRPHLRKSPGRAMEVRKGTVGHVSSAPPRLDVPSAIPFPRACALGY